MCVEQETGRSLYADVEQSRSRPSSLRGFEMAQVTVRSVARPLAARGECDRRQDEAQLSSIVMAGSKVVGVCAGGFVLSLLACRP